jgi:hypothetical protein
MKRRKLQVKDERREFITLLGGATALSWLIGSAQK